MELNLKYFYKEGVKKQIVYIFRDFDENGKDIIILDNLQANIKTILNGIDDAWRSI